MRVFSNCIYVPVGYHTSVSNGPRKSGWLRLRYQTERIWKGQHLRVSLSTFTRQILRNNMKPSDAILLDDWWQMSKELAEIWISLEAPARSTNSIFVQWYLVWSCDDLYQATMGGTCWGHTTAGFEAGTRSKGGGVWTVIGVVRGHWWLCWSLFIFDDWWLDDFLSWLGFDDLKLTFNILFDRDPYTWIGCVALQFFIWGMPQQLLHTATGYDWKISMIRVKMVLSFFRNDTISIENRSSDKMWSQTTCNYLLRQVGWNKCVPWFHHMIPLLLSLSLVIILGSEFSGRCQSMKASLFSPFQADVQGLKGASQYNGWDAHFLRWPGESSQSSLALSLLSFFFFRGCEGIVIEGPNDKGRWEVQVPQGGLRLVEFYCWQICQVDYQCETKTPGSKLVMSVGASNASSPSLAMPFLPCFLGQSFKITDWGQEA